MLIAGGAADFWQARVLAGQGVCRFLPGMQGVSLVVGWGVRLVAKQGVLFVAGKRCGGCHWAGGSARCRQEVWGVLLGRGFCSLQARGVGGAAGQGVLLVAGKRCGGCCWAGAAEG